jgi:1,4-dihydroxy-2-naphthoate octaprenyltransferase
MPHGFLVAGILIANEVPDAPEDRAAHKRTLVVRIGASHGHALYAASALAAFATLALAVVQGALPGIALVAVPVGVVPAAAAWRILRSAPHSKTTLVGASRMAIAAHITVSVALIAALSL